MSDQELVTTDTFRLDPEPSMVAEIGPRDVSPSLEMLFNPVKFAQATHVAKLLSQSESVTPSAWLNKPSACFTVVTMAYNWGLCPFAVMGAAFPLPGGKMGLQGKLIRAIFNQSRAFRRLPVPRFLGDWSKVIGCFDVVQSTKLDEKGQPKTYPKPRWKPQDPALIELGVELTFQLHGFPEETYTFYLHQVGIMFATTWATDPQGQINNAACRAMASARVPWIVLGGAIFDGDVIPPSDTTPQTGPAAVPEPSGDSLDAFVMEQRAKAKSDAPKTPSPPPHQPETVGPRPVAPRAAQPDPDLGSTAQPMLSMAIVGNAAPMRFSSMDELVAYARADFDDNKGRPKWVQQWKRINAALLGEPAIQQLLTELNIP